MKPLGGGKYVTGGGIWGFTAKSHLRFPLGFLSVYAIWPPSFPSLPPNLLFPLPQLPHHDRLYLLEPVIHTTYGPQIHLLPCLPVSLPLPLSPRPSLLHFPSEKSRPPRDINQMWYNKTRYNPHMRVRWGNPVRGKEFKNMWNMVYSNTNVRSTTKNTRLRTTTYLQRPILLKLIHLFCGCCFSLYESLWALLSLFGGCCLSQRLKATFE